MLVRCSVGMASKAVIASTGFGENFILHAQNHMCRVKRYSIHLCCLSVEFPRHRRVQTLRSRIRSLRRHALDSAHYPPIGFPGRLQHCRLATLP
jgi:hypothetical protein